MVGALGAEVAGLDGTGAYFADASGADAGA